jgi:hypothetical protein
MIKIVFTKHALERLRERGISEKEVREFIKNLRKENWTCPYFYFPPKNQVRTASHPSS